MSLNDDAKFCTGCGTPVTVEEENVVDKSNGQDDIPENTTEVQTSENKELESFEESTEITTEPVECCDKCESTESVSGGNKAPKGKKFPGKFAVAICASVAIVAVVGAIFASAFPYIKNAVTKTFSSPEEYLYSVVTSNVDGFVDDFAESLDNSRNYIAEGTRAKASYEITKGDGLNKLFSDIDFDDTEYIDWFKKAVISLDGKSKDNVLDINYGLKLNGVDFGELEMLYDMNNMAIFYGFGDYSSQYVGLELPDYSGSDAEEATEMLRDILEAMPDKKVAEKIINRYIDITLGCIENVEEESKTIQAGGVSQSVTCLSFDIDGKFIKNLSTGILEEFEKDADMHKIIDDICDAVEIDADGFWDEVDYLLSEANDFDEDDFTEEIEVEIYVNSRGEIIGFDIDAGYATIKSYSTEKGNDFGAIFEIGGGLTNMTFEGSGKQSGNKKTGEFTFDVMGTEIINLDIKNLDAEKLKNGLVDGTIKISLADDAISIMRSYLRYMSVDSDIIDAIESFEITIKSSQKSFDDFDCKISLDYKNESAVELSAKGEASNYKKKIDLPSDFADAMDDDEIEEWAENFNFDKLIKRMKKAKLPVDIIDAVEEAFENLY